MTHLHVSLRIRYLGLAVLAACVVRVAPVSAQAPTLPGTSLPQAVGVSILHLNVANLEQSLALYRDVLGMEVTTPPREPRPNPGLVSDSAARMRTVILKQPGGPFSLELVEFTGVALRPVQPRIQDPGAVMLAMNVRDLDGMLTGARRLGLRVLTRNGEPFMSEGRNNARNRAVMVRDPDGFVVELLDSSVPNPGAAPGPIGSVAVWITVQDLAKTVDFYNTVFGFTMPAPSAASPANERLKALFADTPITAMRSTRGTFPGSDFEVNFQEFSGAERTPARHRVQDPGGPILLVQVREFPAVIEMVRSRGGIVGQGEVSEPLGPDVRASWVRDPNGVLLRLSPPAAPRGGGAPVPAPRP